MSMQRVVRDGNIVVLDDKDLHIRNARDGTVIKLDVNSGLHTLDSEWPNSLRQAGKSLHQCVEVKRRKSVNLRKLKEQN